MRRLVVLVSTLSLLILPGIQAHANAGSGTFSWEAGAGLVCGVEESACPDIARASNGDIILVRAEGDFNIANGAASGGGTFEHRNSAGALLASGTLTANRLLAFSFYGCGEDGLPSNFCGGRAALAVHLVAHLAGSTATVEADGILQVDCLIGNPPGGANEGIRLNVKDLINFNKSVSGDTLFIRTS